MSSVRRPWVALVLLVGGFGCGDDDGPDMAGVETVRVKEVGEEELRRVDPELRSVVNVNTMADWARVRQELEASASA